MKHCILLGLIVLSFAIGCGKKHHLLKDYYYSEIVESKFNQISTNEHCDFKNYN